MIIICLTVFRNRVGKFLSKHYFSYPVLGKKRGGGEKREKWRQETKRILVTWWGFSFFTNASSTATSAFFDFGSKSSTKLSRVFFSPKQLALKTELYCWKTKKILESVTVVKTLLWSVSSVSKIAPSWDKKNSVLGELIFIFFTFHNETVFRF